MMYVMITLIFYSLIFSPLSYCMKNLAQSIESEDDPMRARKLILEMREQFPKIFYNQAYREFLEQKNPYPTPCLDFLKTLIFKKEGICTQALIIIYLRNGCGIQKGQSRIQYILVSESKNFLKKIAQEKNIIQKGNLVKALYKKSSCDFYWAAFCEFNYLENLPIKYLTVLKDIITQEQGQCTEELIVKYVFRGLEFKTYHCTSALVALQSGCFNCFQEYFKDYENPYKCYKNNNTLLHSATMEENKIEFIKYLIKYGADVNARNDSDDTPLFLAVKYNNKEYISYLLENKADPEALNVNKQSPLSLAQNNQEILQLFLDYRLKCDKEFEKYIGFSDNN